MVFYVPNHVLGSRKTMINEPLFSPCTRGGDSWLKQVTTPQKRRTVRRAGADAECCGAPEDTPTLHQPLQKDIADGKGKSVHF